MAQQTPAAQTTESLAAWAKNSWHTFDFQQWSEEIGGTSASAVRAAVCFGLGFALGFLFRKYFKMVLFSVAVVLVSIKLLEYNQVLTVSWDGAQELVGIQAGSDVNNFLQFLFEWVRNNIVMFISGSVGFFVGHRLG